MPSGNKFKGNDRRLLKKCKKVLGLILSRDAFVTALPATTRTSRVSNRIEMLFEPGSPLVTPASLILARIDIQLAAQW